MRSFLAKFITITFLLIFGLLKPLPVYAFACNTAGANVFSHDSDHIKVVVELTNYKSSLTSGYVLKYKGDTLSSSGDFDLASETITFIVPISAIHSHNVLSNNGSIRFVADHPNDDSCDFRLENSSIQAAMGTSPLPTPSPSPTTPTAASAAEDCTNVNNDGSPIDDDGDGLPNCLDPECFSHEDCEAETGLPAGSLECDVGTPTALGGIPSEPICLARWVLQYGILAGGGIAFLLSLWGGLTIILAAGNPEKINEGKQIITSAVSGLLIIILSVFLLRFFGLDILQIPGFLLS